MAGTRLEQGRGFALPLVLVGLLALTVRVLVVVLVDPHVPRLGDASAYHLLANHLADGRGYIRPFDLTRFDLVVPTAEYPPLHPFALSLVARLGVRGVEGQRLVLGCVGAGTCVLVALVGRRVAGATVGVVAGVIAACSPMMFLPDATLMSETIFVFLVTLALLLALRLRAEPSAWGAVALGVVLGLAVLTRAEAAVLTLLLAAPFLVVRPRAVLPGVLVVVSAALVVVPWTIRNQTTFHRLVPVSNNVGTALAGANCDLTYAGPSLGSWRSTFGAGDEAAGRCFRGFNGTQPGFDEAAAAADARRQGLDYARDHLGEVPKVLLARLGRTFGVFRPAQQIQLEALEGRPHAWEQAGTWAEWGLYLLAAYGAVVLVRTRAPAWPLLASLLSVIVATLATYGNQRFRIGAEPAVIVAAATGLVAAVRGRTGVRGAPAPSVE